MSTVRFTSDLHFGHPKVAEIRGFASVEEHDAAVADRWASVVGPRDKVYVLGDVTGDSRSLPAAIRLLRALPGEKHLIAGNHDACHPMNPRAHRATNVYYCHAFESVQASGIVKIAGESVLLSHFPYTRDRGEPRYRQWRLPNLGAWLLHGHTHGTEKATVDYYRDRFLLGVSPEIYAARALETFTPAREIHVGVDAWDLTPVSLDTVAALIKEHTS